MAWLFQVERHHKTGGKEIDFPDGTRKYILPSGQEMSEFPDGVTVVEYPEVCVHMYKTKKKRVLVGRLVCLWTC